MVRKLSQSRGGSPQAASEPAPLRLGKRKRVRPLAADGSRLGAPPEEEESRGSSKRAATPSDLTPAPDTKAPPPDRGQDNDEQKHGESKPSMKAAVKVAATRVRVEEEEEEERVLTGTEAAHMLSGGGSGGWGGRGGGGWGDGDDGGQAEQRAALEAAEAAREGGGKKRRQQRDEWDEAYDQGKLKKVGEGGGERERLGGEKRGGGRYAALVTGYVSRHHPGFPLRSITPP